MKGRLCPRCGTVNSGESIVCVQCSYHFEGADELERSPSGRREHERAKFLGDKVLAVDKSGVEARKLVTILYGKFFHLASLNHIMDRLEVFRIIEDCFANLTTILEKHGGTVTLVRGEGFQALFGAPMAHEDHFLRACNAALETRAHMRKFGKEVSGPPGELLDVGLGICSDLIVMGTMSQVLGVDPQDVEDPESIGSRIRDLVRPGLVLVDRKACKLAEDYFDFQTLETGRSDAAAEEFYELLGARLAETRIQAQVAKGLTRFVGRAAEMDALVAAVNEARAGRGQAVGIVGDAGVGKSRLIIELRRRLPQGAQTFLEGRCRTYGGGTPYLPFIDMLRCYFEIQETESAASIKRKLLSKLSRWEYGLEETLPPLQEILSLAVEDSSYLNLETKRKRERSFEAIKRVFERQSSEKLLVLVAEDLHWIDNTSQDLLTYLLGELSGLRILILMLYRPEYSAPLSAESLFREMRLSHLTAESTKELVTSLLKDSSLSSELMEVIFTRTGGNPLFVEEFTRNLLDKGWIRREEDKWGLVPDSNGLRIPDTIRGVIGARMDRLKQASKLTMQLASVIGREFAISLLGALPGVPKELENNLAELQRFDFIFWLGSDPEDKCVFRHALTQEAAYSSLTAANRRRFHIDVGTAIEGLHKDRLEEVYEWLAYHYSKGEQWDQALKYLKLSTMKAISRNSPAEAFMSVKEALALLRARPPTKKTKRDELDILTMVQWAVRFLTHSLKEVDQYLKRGEELALELRDEESVSLFRAALCVYYSSRGETILSQEYLDDLLKEVQTQEREALTRDQLRLVVPLAFGSSWAGYISGRFSDILPINSKILKRMEEAEAFTESYETPFNAYAFLCAMSASASAWLGNFDNAVALAEKGLNVALGAQHFGSAGFVELHYGMAFAARGLGREALAHSTKSAEYYEIAKFGLAYLGPPWQITGYTYFLLDDLDSALRWITKGLQAQLDSGLHHYVALAYANLSTVHLALGNFQRAQSCVQEAMNWSETCGEPHLGALSKILAGTILAKSEHLQFAKAEALILEGIDTFKKLGMKPFYAQGFLHLGELFLNVGRNRAAIKYLKRAEKLFAEMEIGYWLSRTRKILESHQG